MTSSRAKLPITLALATLLVATFAPAQTHAASAEPAALPTTLDRAAPATLADVARDLYLDLGFSHDPAPAIEAARLSPEVAGGVADVLAGLRTCARLVSPDDARALLASADPAPPAPWAPGVKACGEALTLRVEALSTLLDAPAFALSGTLDLWPVVFLEFDGADTDYLHDYLLIVDKGGADEYYNNAGGTIIDVLRGPASSPLALSNDPARGCQTDAELNTGSGNCVPSGAAALLDKGGDDVYGRLETPQADAVCTSDLIVRRLATIGSGVAGVGILVDEGGDDSYLGKTLSIGMGHSGGFGLLRDLAGADTYSAIRSSIGAGVLVGLGVLEDRRGNDVYTDYDPVGGVIDNNNVCRAGNANTIGAGLIGAVGILRDRAGDDSYTGGDNSVGSGTLVGVGIFLDEAGQDTYATPSPGRADGATVVGPTGLGGVGVFIDAE